MHHYNVETMQSTIHMIILSIIADATSNSNLTYKWVLQEA